MIYVFIILQIKQDNKKQIASLKLMFQSIKCKLLTLFLVLALTFSLANAFILEGEKNHPII